MKIKLLLFLIVLVAAPALISLAQDDPAGNRAPAETAPHSSTANQPGRGRHQHPAGRRRLRLHSRCRVTPPWPRRRPRRPNQPALARHQRRRQR